MEDFIEMKQYLYVYRIKTLYKMNYNKEYLII